MLRSAILAACLLAAPGLSQQLAQPALESLVPHAHAPAQEHAKATQQARPAVYDEKADGRAQIAKAVAQAKRNHRRVLIQWGANWCSWCLLLDKTFQGNAEVRHELSYEYDLVHIDIGQFDKHMDLAKELGIELKAVPHLTILDADGRPLAQVDTGPLETKNVDGSRGHDPKRVLEMLQQHRAPRVAAKVVLKEALQEARRQGKRLFLTFGAPW